ncbi:MAG: SUMF1/EgtB/PvdO family nonheme iron enzyme [Sandaracinaceae bacterium]
MRRTAPLALALLALGCSIEPFEPIVGVPRDAGGRVDGGGADGGDRDAASVRDGSNDAAGGEDCANGADDDGDGLVDCEDEDCTAFECAPPPVAGAMLGVVGTGCTREIASGSEGIRADDVECADTCACGAPTAVGCSATIRGRINTSCGSSIYTARVDSTMRCDDYTTPVSGIDSVSVSATATCGLTGPARPAVSLSPPVTPQGSLSVCAVGGGCPGTAVCAPRAEPLCAVLPGNVSCPAALPWRRHLITDVADGRDCADCRCTVSGSCSAELRTWTNPGCADASTQVAIGTACQPVPTASSASIQNEMPSGVACDAAGGGATGCVGPGETVTVCCPASAGPSCPTGPGPAMLHRSAPGGDFCIDSTEVTNEQYAAFLAAGPVDSSSWPTPCTDWSDMTPRGWPPPPGRTQQPVVDTAYCQAWAYCDWAGKRLCGRIGGGVNTTSGAEESPTTSEWAWACTAGDTEDPRCDDSVRDVMSDPCCSLDGLYDLAGNADEWVACSSSVFCFTHSSTSCDNARSGPPGGNILSDDVGFRCCADPSP